MPRRAAGDPPFDPEAKHYKTTLYYKNCEQNQAEICIHWMHWFLREYDRAHTSLEPQRAVFCPVPTNLYRCCTC